MATLATNFVERVKNEFNMTLDEGQFYALMFGLDKKLRVIVGAEPINKSEKIEFIKAYYKRDDRELKLSQELKNIAQGQERMEEKLEKAFEFVVQQAQQFGRIFDSLKTNKLALKLEENRLAFVSGFESFEGVKRQLFDENYPSELALKLGVDESQVKAGIESQRERNESLSQAYLNFMPKYAETVASVCVNEAVNYKAMYAISAENEAQAAAI